MRIFGLTVTRPKQAVVRSKQMSMSAVPEGGGGLSGWWGLIRESYPGAWQQNVTVDAPRELLAFSAVFACVTRIAADVAKLRIRLMRQDDDEIWIEVKTNSPFLAVLRKPNTYQHRIKFIEQWVISKLLTGNTYVLKQRDARRVVTALYVLDPNRVTPLVTTDGDVYYRLSRDDLSRVDDSVVVPASEIIHDMMVSLWHPLVGVSPIYACAMSATQGNKIQTNSANFFANMSRPSGILTAPGTISEETANRIKALWETNFSGGNIGRLAVLGDDLKYIAMTIPAEQAQLIDQLKWTVEDVARAFHMPLYKLGGPQPAVGNIEALNQAYYTDCLQEIIENIEICLDEGLALPSGTGTELDLSGLLRMDSAARYEKLNRAIGAGWLAPNEARKSEDYPPVKGGNSPVMQQQNFSLEALAKRDAREDPFAKGAGAPAAPKAVAKPQPAPAPRAANDEAAQLADLFVKALEGAHAESA